ncbi:LLM class flavin-dependent oxidoreductase [Amycolatopsis sp. OK19-0408]|uniref:LLM class flavin-dependent oxidoreductase n=1 Tax=Amycolatopsis iheyensis TaxID=2945988 RepID=A0A9X2SK20_9PSEU|nr:LLM class flavin-dependent oxidoreductase [Amycolatopsis iheyensis]MCR6485019.1 LLM class flavin-dependent oxidoreductase [Amycolatopsis iheyensis]
MTEFGLAFQSDKRPGDYARLAAAAEEHGFDVLSVFGDLTYQPPIFPLLEMAAATSRVRLGAACWNPYTLHPYEIGGQVAALDLASGGRAYLGLARGSWLGDIGVGQPKPRTHLREAAGFVRALLKGEPYTGEVFRLATRLSYPPERTEVPLLIGTWGARTAALAGELGAAEVKIGGTANPAVVAVMRERIANPAVGVVVGAVTVVDEDGARARALARTEVAKYMAVVAELDPTVEIPADLLLAVKTKMAQGDEEGAGALIPRDLLSLFAFAGTPAEVAAQARALVEAGVDRVEFGTPHGVPNDHGVRLLGTEVLPALR